MAMKKLILILITTLFVACGPSKEELEKQTNEIHTKYNTSAVTEEELQTYVMNKACGCNDEATKAIEAKFKPLNEVVEPQSEVTTPVSTNYSKFSSL